MLELRPHHIYCPFFTDFGSPDRGEEFLETTQSLWNRLRGKYDLEVKFDWGPDQICKTCDHYSKTEDRCVHPEGDEEEIQKWDHSILKALDLDRGAVISDDELRRMIRRLYPLDFCIEKCPYNKSGLCDPGTSSFL